MLTSNTILPPKYYLQNFHYVLDFVEKHYPKILAEEEYHFYSRFRNLSEIAQCLYVRLYNRRGRLFRASKLHYKEISPMQEAVAELEKNEIIHLNKSVDRAVFRLFTKSELSTTFEFLKSTQKKSDMLEELTELDLIAFYQKEHIIELIQVEEMDFIKLLFFGDPYTDMTEFVLRDVGHLKLELKEFTNFKPWFQHREEALGVQHLSVLSRLIYDVSLVGVDLSPYLEGLPWDIWLSYPHSKKKGEKVLLKIAQYLEKTEQLSLALQYYEMTSLVPSRERRVRILEKLKQPEAAIELTEEIKENPLNKAEELFAKDYLRRKGKRIERTISERIKLATQVEIRADENTSIEQSTLLYFEQQGWQGIHSENMIWRMLFGLVFWEVIFDDTYGTYHHPLQRQPSDFLDLQFYELRKEGIQKQLKNLRLKKQLVARVMSVSQQKWGVSNPFVVWTHALFDAMIEMIKRLPLGGIKEVLEEMAKNLKENSIGFPDIFLWKDNQYQFYEIKSVNDSLSPKQLFWIDFLNKSKIKAEVLRVINPS